MAAFFILNKPACAQSMRVESLSDKVGLIQKFIALLCVNIFTDCQSNPNLTSK
jgi:hypothetical protein